MNRPDFLIRQLNYYASVSSKHPIYIGDASNESEKGKIESAIKSFQGQIEIHYHYLPGMNIRKTITHLGEIATEEYCAIICDDDYLIPSSLEKCASFLSKNPDYRTAQGKAVIFTLNENGPYGTLKGSMVYWDNKCCEFETAKQRVEFFAYKYWVPQFSVHRRDEFVSDSIIYRDIEDESFGELLHCFTFISKGKSKFIDCLYLIRQGHDSRYILPGILDWITGEKWNISYNKFIESIGDNISKTDNLPIEEGLRIIKEAFKEGYLKQAIKKSNGEDKALLRPAYHQHLTGKVKNFLTDFIRNRPLLKRSIKNIRSKYLKTGSTLDFDFLLQRDSPYYADAKAVYDNFTTPGGSDLKAGNK